MRIRIRVIFENWFGSGCTLEVKIQELQRLKRGGRGGLWTPKMKPWALTMEAWRFKMEPRGSVDHWLQVSLSQEVATKAAKKRWRQRWQKR
jgi:hypothetical protein